jgi:hypothetical protein
MEILMVLLAIGAVGLLADLVNQRGHEEPQSDAAMTGYNDAGR